MKKESDALGRQVDVEDALDNNTGTTDLSFTGDLLIDMLAENGEICIWKLRFDDWIWSRILSKVLEASFVRFISEVISLVHVSVCQI